MSQRTILDQRTHPYDVGILLVHGIGQQRRGDTLVDFGGPVVDCLQKYLTRLAASTSGKTHRTCRAELESAQLRSADSEAPAHAEVTLHDVDRLRQKAAPTLNGSDSRLVVAESWWADAFPEPDFRQMLDWMISNLPVTLVSHFDRQFRRAVFELRNPDNFANILGKLWRLCRAVISLFLGSLVVPPIVCIFVLALIIGILPFSVMRAPARSLQRLVVATLGDSYSLLENQLNKALITSTVHRDIQWLASRCEKVAVIAHSQGGAIAHEVFLRKPLAEGDLLITYGSGLQKLALIEEMKKLAPHGWQILLWSAIMGLSLTALAVFVLLFRSQLVGPTLLVGSLSLAVAIAALTAWLWRTKRFFSFKLQSKADRELYNRRFRLPGERRIRWIDVQASEDPVPNGPLLDEYAPGHQQLVQCTVINVGSPVNDHTTYWQSSDDFVPLVVGELLLLAGIDPYRLDEEAADRHHAASGRRHWRVAWRRLGWLTALIATVATALRLVQNPPEPARQGLSLVGGYVAEFPGLGPWLVPAGSQPFLSPLGVLAGVAMFSVLTAAFGRAWSGWDRLESDVLFDPRGVWTGYSFWTLRFLLYAFWLLATLILALSFALGPRLFSWLLASSSASLAALLAVLYVSDLKGWSAFYARIKARAAVGSLDQLRKRWSMLDRRYFEQLTARSSSWSTYLVGHRQLQSSSIEDREQGIVTLERAIELSSADAALALGQYLEEQGDHDGARLAYEKGKEKGDSLCTHWLGRLYETEFGQEDEAVESFYHATFKLQEPEPLSAHSLGLLLRRRGDIRGAIKAYKKGAGLRDVLSCSWLGDLYKDLAEVREERGDFYSGEILFRGAIGCYQRAVEFGDETAARDLGVLLRHRDDISGALHAFSQGTLLRSTECALELGKLFEQEGRLEEALHASRRALELALQAASDPAPCLVAEAAWELGRRLEARGHSDAAHRLYRLALEKAEGAEKSEHSAKAALRLGRASVAGEGTDRRVRTDAAEANFRRGLELGNAEAGILLAELLVERGETDAGLEALRKADEVEESSGARATVAFAALLAETGSSDEARRAYRRALDRGSEAAERGLVSLLTRELDYAAALDIAAKDHWWLSKDAALQLARLLLEGGYQDCARRLLERLGGWKDPPEIALEIGRLLERVDSFDRARGIYEAALRRGWGEGAFRLGILLRRTGDAEGAERAFGTARVLGYTTSVGRSPDQDRPASGI